MWGVAVREFRSAWRPTLIGWLGAWKCFADRYDANLRGKKIFNELKIVGNCFASRAANLISRSRCDCGRL